MNYIKKNNSICYIIVRTIWMMAIVGVVFYTYYFYALNQLVERTHVFVHKNIDKETTFNRIEKKVSTHKLLSINLPKPPVNKTTFDEELGVKKNINAHSAPNLIPTQQAIKIDNTQRIMGDVAVDKSSSISSEEIPAISSKIRNPKATQHKKQNTQQVYQQLINHHNMSIELAWPHSIHQYQMVLRYFEQCLGMGFGVITKDKIKPQLLVLLPIDNNSVSPWLRAVSGELTITEQRLMLNYTNSNEVNVTSSNIQKVRLFPAFLDQTLAKYISNALKGETLISFFAQFNVTTRSGHQTLQLAKQNMNGKTISSPWVLHQCE